MSCSEDTHNTPEPLSINTTVNSSSGDCQVIAGGKDVHKVTAKNWTNTPYRIEVDAKCTSDNVRYYKNGAHVDTWRTQFIVRSRRPGWGKGGPREDARSHPLTSIEVSVDQEIETNLSWGVPGFESDTEETLYLTVSTC